MQIYRLTDIETQPARLGATYSGTLAEAHSEAKTKPKHLWPNLRIELFDIDTSKRGILNLLNFDGGGAINENDVLRTWGLTVRGGLNELQKGE